MIGCLRTRVRKQPIIALYFELETVLKFYNLESWCHFRNTSAGTLSPDAFLTFALYIDILISSLLIGEFNREQSDTGKAWFSGSRMISLT